MPGSGKRIDYALRPAKQIQRRMLCDALRRLSPFGSLSEYCYIGLGSYYFVDFLMFHKALAITSMYSIESDDAARCEFNRPLGCITIVSGHTNDKLPGILDPERRTIAWLDYDGRLEERMLGDVRLLSSAACSGSVLIITVNVDAPAPREARRLAQALEGLRRRVGEDRIPLGVGPNSVAAWGMARVCRRIIDNEIAEALADRNSGQSANQIVHYEQLFNFHYSDSARMLTVGGVLHTEADAEKVARARFGEFDFVNLDDAEERYLIPVPHLTHRERRYIDRELPSRLPDDLEFWDIPVEEAGDYQRVHPYFPTYAETEL